MLECWRRWSRTNKFERILHFIRSSQEIPPGGKRQAERMIIRPPPPFSLSLCCFAALFDCEMKLGRLIRCFLSRLILLLSRRRVPLSLAAKPAKLERQITAAASAFKHISGSLMWNRVRLRRQEGISFFRCSNYFLGQKKFAAQLW